MELKSKKKAEAFNVEMEFLAKAKETVDNNAMTETGWKEAYKALCEEYERLLDEAKFLTKISDKLESKLNASNEQLRKYNDELSSESELVKSQKDKILEKNKQLYQEKSELDFKVNRFQLTLIVLIVLLVVVILILIYWQFFKPHTR